MILSLMPKPKSFLPTSTQQSTAKKRMKRSPSKTAKERSKRYEHVLGLLWSKVLGNHPESAEAPHPSCKLGRELRKRRGNMCSACDQTVDLEIDHAVARLVANGTFDGTSSCPYRVMISSVINAIMLGDVTSREAHDHDSLRIKELRAALKHIAGIWGTLARERWEFERLSGQDPFFDCFNDIKDAEYKLIGALRFFEERHTQEERTLPRPYGRGAKGLEELQDIVRSIAFGWKMLTGAFPGKSNVQFHELLRAVATTVFGAIDDEPNWEWHTRSAVSRLKAGNRSEQNLK
jgi:hypothetical protein